MTGALLKKEEGDWRPRPRGTQRDRAREDRGRGQSDAGTSRGTPGATRAEEARQGPPLEASEGAWPCRYLSLDFRPQSRVKTQLLL